MVSVYNFTDYRRFLKMAFLELKKRNPRFSYRSFNRRAGLKSSGSLKLIIDGKRNLAEEGMRMLAKGFQLKEAERNYFELLVKFNQAKDHEEKDRYFQKLSKNKKFLAAKPLTAAQYHLFSHWYYVAILELVRIDSHYKKNAAWIKNRLKPKIGLPAIKRAIGELQQLGLLRTKRNGSLERRETMLTTEDEVQSVSVANFHVQMSRLASQAVLKEAASEREFSTLTIAASDKTFSAAKAEIQKFRKKLHSILEQEKDEPKSLVTHINIQLFKLSHSGTP